MKRLINFAVMFAAASLATFGLFSCDEGVEEKAKPADAGTINGPSEVFTDESITLTIAEIEGAVTYQWYKDGTKIQNTEQRTLTVTEEGTYKVAGVNEAGEGKASPDHVVTLFVPPLPADAGSIEGPTTFVEGESITLEIAAIEHATSYKWYKDGEEIADETERILVVDVAGTYKVAGVNDDGEGNPSPDHVVTSTPAPTVPSQPGAITADKHNPVATGETVTLSIADVEGADTYRWYKDDEAVAGQTATTLAVTEGGIYKVAGVNEVGEGAKSAGCEVVFIPAAAGAISADKPNPVPGGQSVTLSVGAIAGATNYRWYKDGAETMTSAMTSYTVSAAGVYTVAGVNASGVGAQSAAYTVEYVVVPPPADAGTLTADNPDPYYGQTVTLTIAPIENAVKYRWYRGGVLARENTMTTYAGISQSSANTYAVAGVNSEGVEGRRSPDYVVAFRPANAGTITSDNNNPTVGQTVTLTAPTINGSTSYKWYKDEVAIAGQTAKTLAVTESGTYKVAGVNATGEGARSAGLTVTFAAAGGDFIDDLVGTWTISQWVRSGSVWTKSEYDTTISKNADGNSIDITQMVEFKIAAYGNMQVNLRMNAVPVDNATRSIKFPTKAAFSGFNMGTMVMVPYKTNAGSGDLNEDIPAMTFTEVDGKLTLDMFTYGTTDPTVNNVSGAPATMTGVYGVAMMNGTSYGATYGYVCNSVWTKKD